MVGPAGASLEPLGRSLGRRGAIFEPNWGTSDHPMRFYTICVSTFCHFVLRITAEMLQTRLLRLVGKLSLEHESDMNVDGRAPI